MKFSHYRKAWHYRNATVLENPFLYNDLLKIIYNTDSFNSLELRRLNARLASQNYLILRSK
jgi:hypothetical protein